MKTFLKFIITAVLLLTTGHLQAQSTVYPIQLNAVMLPPYTNCLGDYFNSGANRVQVKAILRDMSKYDNSLRFSLSVKVKTGNTVVLESATPYPIELSNANVINDLRNYVSLLFTPEANNTGVRSKGDYAKNGYCLPEGAYEFVFQVFDFYKKNVPLSEPFSMFCYLNQAEAPVAVYPEDGACGVNKAIGLYDNGVQFQWMDPIAYGPSNKVYEFVLTEKSNSTNLAANMFSEITAENKMMMPVYSDKVYNNTFRYVPLSANFQKGKEYCWYVIAKGNNITGEKDGYYAFKNKGVSNKNCFTYGECPAKEEIFDSSKVKKIDNNLKVILEKVDVNQEEKSAEAFWKPEKGDFCKYYVYYYRTDLTDASAEKAVIDGLSSLSTVLKNLEPGKEYACYVIGATNCNKENEPEILSPKSDEYKFKLAEIKMGSDNCEANLELMACDNLLETLDVKDYFYGTTSGEIITVTKITNKGSDNSFSGEGIVSCTLLKNKLGLNVKFDNIYINSDRYLCKGEVRVVHNDVDNLVINLNDFAGKKQGADKAKQQENLGTEVNSLDEAKNYKNQTIIYNGELYAVDSEGNPEKVGKVMKPDETCDLPSSGLDNEDGVIVFDVEKGLNGEKYDPYIDKSPSPFTAELVKKSYEWQYSTYPIAWISMVEGEVRWITAEIGDKRQSESTLKLEDIDFYCYAADGNAVKLDKETYGNKVKLKIYGGKKNTALKIYARKKAEKVNGQCPSDEKTVGVVNIYSMSHQTKKILLAPVLNEMTLNIEQMQNEVNKMFAPLGKKFEFTKGNAFTADNEPELELILMDGINTADGAKHFSKETDEMKYIRQRYTQFASDFSDYDACLFLIPTAQKLGLQGYMPLNKSVGYIIVGENNDVKLDANTIAHELCHGLYDIQHVFDYNGVGEGDLPENIMDYPNSDSNVNERYLTKYYQWVGVENGQLIHLSFLDDTEDAEGIKDIFNCVKKKLPKWKEEIGYCVLKGLIGNTVDIVIDKCLGLPEENQEVHWIDNLCGKASMWIPVEEETLETVCQFTRTMGMDAFNCLKDGCLNGKQTALDNIGSSLLDFLFCAFLNETTKDWQTCACENLIGCGFSIVKDLFISPRTEIKFRNLKSKNPKEFENAIGAIIIRIHEVGIGIAGAGFLADNKQKAVAQQFFRSLLSKDEEKLFIEQFCEWLNSPKDNSSNTNVTGGNSGAGDNSDKVANGGGSGTGGNKGNVANGGGSGAGDNSGKVANGSGNGTGGNKGNVANGGGSGAGDNGVNSNNKIQINTENVSEEMAMKVFTHFIYDVMGDQKYFYSAEKLHDTHAYKSMIKLINNNSSYYFDVRNDELASPKTEIYELIKKLIGHFDPIQITYINKCDYVRKVCSLVASQLCNANTTYSVETYNSILQSPDCKFCDFSKFKAISQVLHKTQSLHLNKKEGDNAYSVSMFLVDPDYMTLPYVLKYLDR